MNRIYWVYADSVVADDLDGALATAAAELRRKPDALTARYVITASRPFDTIARLRAGRGMRGAA